MSDLDKKLNQLRKEIDKTDAQLLKALGHRMAISKKIGYLKKEHGLPILQKSRWKKLMASRLAQGKKLDLNAKWLDGLYRLIHSGSIAVQLKVVKEKARKKK